ncbi:MAG: hypothetical protein AAF702_27935 [Chloroflexota bacterium]
MHRLSTPVYIGLLFGSIGVLLTVIGIFRGNVPSNPASMAIALLIGGGVWFLVSWVVAAAAADVEADVAEATERENAQGSVNAESESGSSAHE